MMSSRWLDIYNHLSEAGIKVYSPGQKSGECTSPYVVVRTATSSQYKQFSTTMTYYDLLCYVPGPKYSTLEPFVERVKEIMKGLTPMIRPTYDQTQSYYDDQVKAHMISIQYLNYRKI